jgi:CDP-paratose 2-epimerase
VSNKRPIANIGGGVANSISLAQLSTWCAKHFGPRNVATDSTPRPFDIPWMVLDSTRAAQDWNWQVATPLDKILGEIADHAQQHPDWLKLSAS